SWPRSVAASGRSASTFAATVTRPNRRAPTLPRSSRRTRGRCSTTSVSASATWRGTRWAPPWLSARPSMRPIASSAPPPPPRRAGAGRRGEERQGGLERPALVEHGTPGEPFRRSLPRWFSDEFRCANPELLERYAARNMENDPRAYAAAYHVLATTDLADEAA